MEWQDLLSDGYGQAHSSLKAVLEGLVQEDLDWQHKPDCNSIGWLAWHLVRQQDAAISWVTKDKQLWISEGWHEKFKRPADPLDYGTGQKPEQVAAFKSPPVDTIIGYSRAVKERTKKYIRTLVAADLDRTFKVPGFEPPPTVGSWLLNIMLDCVQHAGQAGYVRGLRTGMGWQKH